MKQFTPTEAKKLVKDILAEKKKKAEYFQANGTLKGFASAKQFLCYTPQPKTATSFTSKQKLVTKFLLNLAI